MRNIRISSLLLIIYTTVLLAFSIMPQYRYSISYKMLFVISIPFVIGYVVRYVEILKNMQIILLNLVLLVVFRFVINTYMDFSASVNASLMLYICIISYFIFEAFWFRNKREESKNEILMVIAIISVMIAIVVFKTFKEFAVNPNVARLLSRGTTDDENINMLRRSNIGGYGFAYAMGMLSPYLAMLTLKIKKNRIVPIILLVIDMVFCAYTQYTILLLFSVFFVILVYSSQIQSKGLRIVIILLVGVFLVSVKSIIYFIAMHTEFQTLSVHLLDIVAALSGEKVSSGRGGLYGNALQLFLQSPLWGVDLRDANSLYIINHSHSTLLSNLASGGLIGTGLYYGVYLNIIGNIKKKLPNFKDIMPVYIMLLTLSVVNPITHLEIMAMVFLFVPLAELYRSKSADTEEIINV